MSLSPIDQSDDSSSAPSSLFLNVGLSNGVLLRTQVDTTTGQLTDSRTRFLGLSSPRLVSILLRGAPALLALSSRPWLGFTHAAKFLLTPLSYDLLEHAAPFSSDQCPEGVVAVAGQTLRVFGLDRGVDKGEAFNSTVLPLRYTPRRALLHPTSRKLVVIESDQGAFSADEREGLRKEAIEVTGAEERLEEERRERKAAAREARGAEGEEEDEEEEEEEEEDESLRDPLPEEQFGYPKTVPGQWASCIRVMDVRAGATTCLLELSDGEAALSLATAHFNLERPATKGDRAAGDAVARPGAGAGAGAAAVGPYVVVGTAQGLQRWPKQSAKGGFLHVYKCEDEEGTSRRSCTRRPWRAACRRPCARSRTGCWWGWGTCCGCMSWGRRSC